MNRPRPLLLLEINEIPWRLIDHFVSTGEYPALEYFFSQSENLTTKTVDEGELSPWITWPTFHRGIPALEHGVKFLGQDPTTFRGTTIWEEFRREGNSIGICGSLQSWPPIDPGAGGFFVPDTFADSPACYPKWVESFQAINLRLTGENGRVINRRIPWREAIRLLPKIPRLGLRPGTLLALANQLIAERFQPRMVARRPTFQAILLWDIFRKLFHEENPPAFSTFFTNHVASAMHRYWHDIFPEDFKPPPPTAGQHLPTMKFAMRVLDQIVAEAIQFQKNNPQLILAIASSMGQAAATWDRFHGTSTIIDDCNALLKSIGVDPDSFESLAMVPQVTIRLNDHANRALCRKALTTARSASGEQIFFIEELGEQLSVTILTPSLADIEYGGFRLAGGKKINWNDAGIKIQKVEPGSAYHIPEGILAVLGGGRPACNKRTIISATKAKSLLMGLTKAAP